MKYFEGDVLLGDAVCSDNNCPCPNTPIPRGTGYLYIDEALVRFRSKYPKILDAQIPDGSLRQANAHAPDARTAAALDVVDRNATKTFRLHASSSLLV